MSDSSFFENLVLGALHKAWKGYVIAKNKGEDNKMVHYADIIQECQYDLGRPVSSFHHIRMSALAFTLCVLRKLHRRIIVIVVIIIIRNKHQRSI